MPISVPPSTFYPSKEQNQVPIAFPSRNLPADNELMLPEDRAFSRKQTRKPSIDGISRQLVGVHVRIAWDLPEACLHTKFINLVTEIVELLNEISIAERKAAGIEVAVVAPLNDLVCHAVDRVRRIGLDDDLVDAARILVSAVSEDVSELSESVDRGGQLGALTGWDDSVVELERLVVHVVATPVDAAPCNSV